MWFREASGRGAWRIYSDDSHDRFPPATGLTVGHPDAKHVWMTGHLDFDPGNRSNWDVEQDIKQPSRW